jgi:Baseplate J-like protein
MSCTGTPNCDCGCCAGTSVQTPQVESNLPGLASIAYRAGTWATFNESMLARLSSSDYPALSSLKTRDNDDFTIAFLDATAMVLDILTFYQERLANESYLRTAAQLQSLIELSRLIGYQPSPGVSASGYVAFTLKAAPGQPPDPTAPPITIPLGTQLQSVPAQGQTPQTFETFADIQAKADWNALPVQTGQPWLPPGAFSLYLSGTLTKLQIGDSLLILGVDREGWEPVRGVRDPIPNDQWDVVVLNDVQVDNVRNLTYVSWDQRLTHASGKTSGGRSQWTAAKVFAFRQKAALFGNNAPSPYLFVNLNPQTSATIPTSLPGLITVSGTGTGTVFAWNDYLIASSASINLDASYPKIVVDSWFALVRPGAVQLFKVDRATSLALAKFGLSAKVTELAADFDDLNISAFSLQGTSVWAQSDQLAIPEQPLDYPLYGTSLDLHDSRPDLVGAQVVAVSGKRQKLSVADQVILTFIPADDPTDTLTLNPGDWVTLTDPTPLPINTVGIAQDWSTDTKSRTLNVEDTNGRPGTVQAQLSSFQLTPSGSTDPTVSEYALVSTVGNATKPYPHTQILLQSVLSNCYDRTTTTVNANVGLATQGQSVSEVLGNGSASTPNQSFTLKQSPLTFIQAPTPTGRQSTLSVRANGAAWTEVPSLYNQGPYQQVYATLNQVGGTTKVMTGDGVEEGATLPTGQNNIQATYRIGLGSAGNVGAGALSTLMDRPLGVSGVTNPEPATGGQDADSIDDVRANAPLTVLTLGRAVSITDYQNYAASFAGIAKAYAIWIPSGAARGVFVTVAGAGGAALPNGNPTLSKLVTSLHNYGNPLIPITAVSFLETLFGFSADLKYDPAYDAPTVKAQVRQALYQAYSFEQRTFGQGVSADELATFIQAVPGVVAVNVKRLQVLDTSTAGDLASQPGGFSVSNLNTWLSHRVTLKRPYSDTSTQICAYLPVPNLQALPMPAEILVLDPDPTEVVLGVMA